MAQREYESSKTAVQQNFGPGWSECDRAHMRSALELAKRAQSEGEVPVGAVLVRDEIVIGEGWNRPIMANDPSAHAEMEAIRHASAKEKNYRLGGTTLYVTLEPCVMCAGALVTARIERLVFAARDLRFGGVRSKFRLADSELLNHRAVVEEGLMSAEAAELMAAFFQLRRDASGL